MLAGVSPVLIEIDFQKSILVLQMLLFLSFYHDMEFF